ncbi:hypothetical protein P5V43_05350 [Mycobacteroides abscessus subsp. bolletii]|uniref:hypothetical protein n=1 Tax=Mycobacteroides abscessus TaxID=36809 RepID=UPI00266DAEB2|nr:hypothetical protein [Mycobacteroides abscessus]MDO3126524.1 hypothetical protein [Mycobacteroides abscessus subsp. bolletii]
MSDTRAVVIVDYQNMHLTAHGKFMPSSPVHHALLHPLNLANQVLLARAAAKAAGAASASATPEQPTLHRVEVFRGLPSNSHDPASYSRSLAQKAEWTRDSRVAVTYRPLRYANSVPREKGIDVLVALKLVELAQSGAYEVVILAAHDTDLEPALETAVSTTHGRSGPSIETAGWQACKRLRPKGAQLWHTFMDSNYFQSALDRKQY